jgi:rhodanese-related sulfurtransferase
MFSRLLERLDILGQYMFSNLFSRGTAQPSPTFVGHDEMVELVNGSTVTLIDVREAGEFAAGHIKGAVNMPLSSLNPAKAPKGKPIVLYCLSGARSARAMEQFQAAGRTDTRNYRAGVSGWRLQGCSLV